MNAGETDFIPRKNFGALFEPENTVLSGAGQDPNRDDGAEGFLEYAEALGEACYPILFMTYAGLTPPVDKSADWGTVEDILKWGKRLKGFLDATGRKDVYPQVGMSMVGGKDSGAGRDDEVAAGYFDSHIDAYIEAMKGLGRPVYLRIGYECEGSWNGYQPETYKAAWIRITKRIREAGIPVATVWCVAGGSSGTTEVEPLMAYYPGDEWVDWWAIDIFSPEEIDAPLTQAFCEEAGRRGKPVMIGEATPRYVGVHDGERSWDNWFGPFFDLIRRQPEIKAISYINWDWDYWADTLGYPFHGWKDSRIQKNPVVLERFREEMKSPLYSHSQQYVEAN